MGEAVEFYPSNGVSGINNRNDSGKINDESHIKCGWYEEVIDDNLKWSFALNG